MTEPADEEPVTCTCGRLLRDPESRARGQGPVCWRKFHGRPARAPPHNTAAAKPGPGQPELPYDDQLEIDIWSNG